MVELGISQFTPTQVERLRKDFPPTQVEILHNGAVYVPAGHVRRRLWDTFAPGRVGIANIGEPTFDAGHVYQEVGLLIDGHLVARARGGHMYYPENKMQDMADAHESAVSKALRRCAKKIGVAENCWDPRWAYRYRRQHGIQVRVQRKKWNQKDRKFEPRTETVWRHRDAPPYEGEIGAARPDPNYQQPTAEDLAAAAPIIEGEVDETLPGEDPMPPPNPVQQIRDVDPDDTIGERPRRALFALCDQFNMSREDLKAHLKTRYGLDSTSAIRKGDYQAIVNWVKSPDAE